jgi:hypothetical protein
LAIRYSRRRIALYDRALIVGDRRARRSEYGFPKRQTVGKTTGETL